jgi:hypothetical protein
MGFCRSDENEPGEFLPKKILQCKTEPKTRVQGGQAPAAGKGVPFCGLQIESMDTFADFKAAQSFAKGLVVYLKTHASRQVDLTGWRIKVCPHCRHLYWLLVMA